MLMLAPAAAQSSQNWAWCVNQRRPLSSSAANGSLEFSSNLMRARRANSPPGVGAPGRLNVVVQETLRLNQRPLAVGECGFVGGVFHLDANRPCVADMGQHGEKARPVNVT
jgi:hypothetical protein